MSQLGVSYRGSPLSVEGTPRRRGGPRAGDRLADRLVTAAGREIRLHDLLAGRACTSCSTATRTGQGT
jgi:hypothetical protein